jgi:RNA polymerase sigma-70 factor (ECF subfamily)
MRADAGADHLTELYRRFGPAVHRRARAVLGDAEEALDVTQDTFLAYMRAEAGLRNEASPFTVLYQIATHKAVDRLRRRSRWNGRLGPLEVDESEEDRVRRLEHPGGLERVEALQDLALLTHGESPQALTAALLYFVEEHTLEEVAQMLDLTRKTVSKLLHQFCERARKRSLRLEPEAAR